MKNAMHCLRSLTRSPLLTLLIAAVALVAAPAIASATPVVYTINQPNPDISGFPGPYGTVTVDLTSGNQATITVATNTSGASGFKYLFGDGSTIALNTNGTATLASAITAAGPFSAPGPFSGPTSGNVSQFGNFNFIIDNFDGSTHALSSMSFTIQKSSGTWSSSADVLVANNKGFSVADHVFVYDTNFNPITNGAGQGITGFAGNGVVPEPSTVALGLISLACMGAYSRFRRRKPAEA